MTLPLPQLATVGLLVFVTAGSPALATDPPATASPATTIATPTGMGADALAPYAFLVGTWVDEKGSDRIEETWFPSAAGAMVGLFRWTRGEKVIVYAMLALEPREGGVVLLLRHFSPGLRAWEDKDAALVFHPVPKEGRDHFWDNRDSASPTRLGYRPGEGDTLVALLERARDGKKTVEEFVYRRR